MVLVQPDNKEHNMKIIWENPPSPAKHGRRSIIVQMLPHLQKNPGRWARVGSYRSNGRASGAAASWRKRYAHLGLEIVSRQGSVYVRYTVDSSSPTEEEHSVLIDDMLARTLSA